MWVLPEVGAGGGRVIGGRSESLTRFMAAYSRLARLPPPQLGKRAVLNSRVAPFAITLEPRRPA